MRNTKSRQHHLNAGQDQSADLNGDQSPSRSYNRIEQDLTLTQSVSHFNVKGTFKQADAAARMQSGVKSQTKMVSLKSPPQKTGGHVSVLSQEGFFKRATAKVSASALKLNNVHRRDRSQRISHRGERAVGAAQQTTARVFSEVDRNEDREIFSQGDAEDLRQPERAIRALQTRGQEPTQVAPKKGLLAVVQRFFSPVSKPAAPPSARNKNFVKSNIRMAGVSKDKVTKSTNFAAGPRDSSRGPVHALSPGGGLNASRKQLNKKPKPKESILMTGTTGGTAGAESTLDADADMSSRAKLYAALALTKERRQTAINQDRTSKNHAKGQG